MKTLALFEPLQKKVCPSLLQLRPQAIGLGSSIMTITNGKTFALSGQGRLNQELSK